GGISGTVSGTAASLFTLATSTSGITLGNITTNAADANVDSTITVSAGAGTLRLAAGKSLTVNEGGIILQNTDTSNGSISIDAGASLIQLNNQPLAFGEIDIFIGATNPTNLTNTTPPANLTANVTNAGQFLIGQNS